MKQLRVFLPTSSKLNRTPPMGAPKATDTPAAAAADKTYQQQKPSLQTGPSNSMKAAKEII